MKRAVVMGLGLFGGGAAAARYLSRQGYAVLATDLRDAETLQDSVAELDGLGVEFRLGEHRDEDFQGIDLLVKNPAVRPDNRYVEIARSGGAEISSEMNLFVSRCPARLVGVTGSNGKTTVAHMLGAMLARTFSGKGAFDTLRAWLGGNFGRSLLDDLPTIKSSDLVVLELSSFQLMDLDRIACSPAIGVLTNVTPNHLDWHRDMAEYVAAKAAIFRYQGPDGLAILNADDPVCAKLARAAPGSRTLLFSLEEAAVNKRSRAAFMRGDRAVVRADGAETPLFDRTELRVPGDHNVANALAAAAAAHALGASGEHIRDALRGFSGVEHRLELATEMRGVSYYNDSIATTPESTIAALRSFRGPLYLLLGGSDKGLSFDALAVEIAKHPGMRAVYVTGPTAPRIAEALHRACRERPDPGRDLRVETIERFSEAVERARRKAPPGAVFLMSPACASFYEYEPGKRFRNFEHRGAYFKELLAELKSQ